MSKILVVTQGLNHGRCLVECPANIEPIIGDKMDVKPKFGPTVMYNVIDILEDCAEVRHLAMVLYASIFRSSYIQKYYHKEDL